ncbi:aldehyde dehydrogenase family protein [Diaphorobacter sp. HDW4A]|uniref:aldehyde dehydrogenase family protein n=1 Tax=Diaphorobacter sp. HDW4A TaxID=2714924 RepID=UPI00140A4187|nr:aldehyde dehydrogenase family protein [Diaphorobacter sp. HDW4A]QIL82490.1 aldehyde dehydrogenase family protein [Diaphorobacter sp. HDW4A]
MTHLYDRQYIAGAWCATYGKDFVELADPNTGTIVARVTTGHEQDARHAAQAAGAAFTGWSTTALDDRVRIVRKWAEALEKRKGALVHAIAAEVGTPLKISQIVQVESPLRNIEHFVATVQTLAWETTVGNSHIAREPFGVVACITPWNFPLHQIVLKLAPALLTGNTVVLKPSELTPQTVQLICEALHEASFPDGVVNVVNGTGPVVGAEIATHAAVDMVSFTGSTQAGMAVTALAAQTVKKVATELGGKSPSVVLSSADLTRAVKSTLASCMLNNGQTCSALTRLLVPVELAEQAHALLRQEMSKLTVGSSLDDSSRVGPLISKRQQANVHDLLEQGEKQGATLIAEGSAVPEQGFFIKPRAYATTADNTLAFNEIFGPVLSVLTYSDVDDAVRLANATVYGLAAAVWGEDSEAMAVARRIRAGQVDINGARFNALAPFGGYKQSGVGREGGTFGVEEFLQVKSIQVNPPSGV